MRYRPIVCWAMIWSNRNFRTGRSWNISLRGVNSLSVSGAKVYAIDGKLYVQAEVPSKIEIYSISGMSVLEDSVGVGENQYDLLPGFYIVKVGSRTTKVLVK